MNEVILVDEKDNEIGTEEKQKAHLEGKLHRAVSVFLFNSNGQLLLQQRALGKYHSGGLWTNTCCSHQGPGEKTIDACHRRLQEELGLKNCELREIFSFMYKVKLDKGITEHEFDHVVIGTTNEEPTLDKEEVADYKWIDPTTLTDELKNNPSIYTYWFKKVWDRVYKETVLINSSSK